MALGKKELASFCSQLATMLEAGLPVRRALATLEHTGHGLRVKSLAARIGLAIEGGATLTEALTQQGRRFPPLMLHLVRVGEQAGTLDDVLKRLGEYFELMRQIQRTFLVRLIYPAAEILIAIFVLGVLRYVLTMIGDGGSPEGELAKVWLGGYGGIALLVALYFVLMRTLASRRIVHEIILRIPVIRYVSRSLALARFSWSMEMMNEAGMPILEAIERSLMATNNGAFQWRAPAMTHVVAQGGSLTEALEEAGVFPVDYCEVVRVGEESGSLSDTFRRLARQHFENAEHGMKAAATALGWLIWLVVAAFLVYHIITLWMRVYIGPLRDASSGNLDWLEKTRR